MKMENILFAGLCVTGSGSLGVMSLRLGGAKKSFGTRLQMAPRPPVAEDSSYTIAILGDCKSMDVNFCSYPTFLYVCLRH